MNCIVPSWPAPPHIKAFTTTRLTTLDQIKWPSPPIWLKQVHGNRVVIADEVQAEKPEADAAITRKKNVVCVVRTADCLPILLCDQAGCEIAAIHAGWKGLATGIIAATLQAMATSPARILAWLGPAICAANYEVGDDVRDRFAKFHDCFTRTGAGKWWMDLHGIARQQLTDQGSQHIYGGEYCTYTDKERFYSYRRDGANEGRMFSCIWLT